MNLNELTGRIRATVDSHRLAREGEYANWLWQNAAGTRDLGVSAYGCADAANILYTLNDFPRDPRVRQACVNVLKGLQDRESGLYRESHHPIHTTAHCLAALELFDAAPDHPLTALLPHATVEGLYALLESLDWKGTPWPQSHQGAGVYAALVLSGHVDEAWCGAYFDWLWDECDPETGLWRKGLVTEGTAPVFHHMGGTFHYVFNHEYARRPLRYPERLIDTCLALYADGQIGEHFGRHVGFLEIDWTYCVTRASRQTPYRFADGKAALRRFARDYVDYLYSLDWQTDDGFNDLHMLFGAVCCLAELMQALPGELTARKPLRLVLDRRPFI